MKGCENLGRYNLLEESWIPVVEAKNSESKKVSLIEIFENAEKYTDIATDTKTQDFAITRLLLAILQTVFSRFDYYGNPHEGIELDEKFRQVNDIDEDDIDEYTASLKETWENLWESKKFPKILYDYLNSWKDHFYFLDEKYPFYQVRKEDISNEKLKKGEATEVLGKTINRKICESSNKTALFSPKYDENFNKEIMTEDEALRWLITFQNYSGLSDKAVFDTEKYTGDIGWLFQLGGIYLKGNNLFETLILNLLLPLNENTHTGLVERPCWEYNSQDIIKKRLLNDIPNNLAELYTIWARAIYVDPKINFDEPFKMRTVIFPRFGEKIPTIEPMTLWTLIKKGPREGEYIQRKHKINESLWRSFGMLTISEDYTNNEKHKKVPEIIKHISQKEQILGNYNITVKGISLEDNGVRTSSVPIDEVYDDMTIKEMVLNDIEKDGWVPRINDEVDLTKKVVGGIFGYFISDLMTVRNDKSEDFKNQKVEELYYKLNDPFKEWLASIEKNDDKNKKTREWRDELKSLVKNEAKKIIFQASSRDYRGIAKDGKVMNIATCYNRFINILNKTIG